MQHFWFSTKLHDLFIESTELCSTELFVDDDGSKIVDDEIPLEYKKKAVAVFEKNKKWKFRTFRQKFLKVRDPSYIRRWKRHISMGIIIISYISTKLCNFMKLNSSNINCKMQGALNLP